MAYQQRARGGRRPARYRPVPVTQQPDEKPQARAPITGIHHLNCISTCPLGGRLMDGRTRSLVRRGLLTCHCLLLETDQGLVLVDTGFGLRDVRDPKSRISQFFLGLVSPDFREELTAIRQIERLGLNPADVRHIILTHLDFDHAGGLDDFPEATVHLLKSERDAAAAQQTWLDRQRFRPQQWSTSANWRVHELGAPEEWFAFSAVRPIPKLDVLLVPLIGHTFGHAGVALRRDERWLLDAGDAYFFHREMDLDRPHCTPGLRFYQWMMEKNRKSRLRNQGSLRELLREQRERVDVFCSHDVVEFERLSGRTAETPLSRQARAGAAP
jgi:glyoxylase-like metal-dependent hydrolase (beta-lactamase superfamily II)